VPFQWSAEESARFLTGDGILARDQSTIDQRNFMRLWIFDARETAPALPEVEMDPLPVQDSEAYPALYIFYVNDENAAVIPSRFLRVVGVRGSSTRVKFVLDDDVDIANFTRGDGDLSDFWISARPA